MTHRQHAFDFQEDLYTHLMQSPPNQVLRYLHQTTLCHVILNHIRARWHQLDVNSRHVLSQIVAYDDYRLIARYLHAHDKKHQQTLTQFEALARAYETAQLGHIYYQLYVITALRFLPRVALTSVQPYNIIEALLTASPSDHIGVYYLDEDARESLNQLLHTVGRNLTSVIQQQVDIPGLNAVIRGGNVRMLYLPDGQAVISKQEDASRPSRFMTEIENYVLLRNKMASVGDHHSLVNANTEETINVTIGTLLALIHDGYSHTRYMLFKQSTGQTLEEILWSHAQNPEKQNSYLRHYRLILDWLFEYGILWGDMSPRNIIVTENDQVDMVTYTLIDFEKTTIQDNPINHQQRITFCRGQLIAEELINFCSLQQICDHFKPYYQPNTWNTEHKVPLPFTARDEICEMLSMAYPPMDIYNQMDKKLLAIRSPYQQNGMMYFTGHVGFKVEHYMTCAGLPDGLRYERRLNALFVRSKEQSCFRQLVAFFQRLAQHIEIMWLQHEFEAICRDGDARLVEIPHIAIHRLKKWIDIYDKRV